MSWIETIDESRAEGPLKQSYEAYLERNNMDVVANILKLFSLSPESFDRHYDFYRQLQFGKGPLRRYQREMIATAVSQINQCHY